MMKIKRGDVVIVLFPFSDLVAVKKRPTLVIQADNLKTGFDKIIIAQISSQTKRVNHSSRVLIPTSHADFNKTGLKQDSVILTDIIATIDTALIDKKIGEMFDMPAVDKALRATLSL